MRRTARAAVATVVTLLALAAGAQAQTFCVHQLTGSCPLSAFDDGADLNHALNVAARPGNTIDLLPGDYTIAPIDVSGTQGFWLQGSGAGVTTIRSDGSSPGDPLYGAADALVSDISFVAPAGGGDALDLEDGAVARNVVVTDAFDNATGVELDDSTLVDSTVTMASSTGTVGVEMDNASGLSIVAGSTLSAFRAIVAHGDAEVDRSTMIGTAGFRYTPVTPGSGILSDDVIRITGAGGNGISLNDSTDNMPSQVFATSTTIDAAGTGGTTTGVAISVSGNAASATVNVNNSIVWDVDRSWNLDLSGGATALSMGMSGSIRVATSTTCSCGAGQVTDQGNTAVDPEFVDPAHGDLHLRFGSPAIDATTGAATSNFDRDGLPRVVNATGAAHAHADQGAYEYQHRPPVAAIAAPATALTGAPVGFDGSASSDPDDGDAITSYAWAFDDGATASGAQVAHAFTTAGPHVATLTVTDSSGLTNTASVTVSVAAPPPPPPPAAPLPKPTPKPAPPKITGLHITKKGLALTLSETATVHVTEERKLSHGKLHTVRTLKHKLAKGGHTIALGSLSAGSYTLVVTATDASGVRSSPHHVALSVATKKHAKH